jgi:hypothetical protein
MDTILEPQDFSLFLTNFIALNKSTNFVFDIFLKFFNDGFPELSLWIQTHYELNPMIDVMYRLSK